MYITRAPCLIGTAFVVFKPHPKQNFLTRRIPPPQFARCTMMAKHVNIGGQIIGRCAWTEEFSFRRCKTIDTRRHGTSGAVLDYSDSYFDVKSAVNGAEARGPCCDRIKALGILSLRTGSNQHPHEITSVPASRLPAVAIRPEICFLHIQLVGHERHRTSMKITPISVHEIEL